MKKAVFLHMEAILRDYPKIDEYIKNRQNSAYYSIEDDRFIASLRWQKKCVSEVLLKTDFATKRVIDALYFQRNPNLTLEGVADHLHISRTNLYYKRNHFLETLRKELGW